MAPQYAEGLTLDMYAYQIVAGNNGQDLAEINTLNHYIGMKPIAQADFLEMKVLPFAIGVFALLALRAVVVGRIVTLVDLSVLFLYFGAFSLGSFAYRLYTYGHHLDPHAPMKIAPFMPVVIGSQQIANFVQTSLPLAGTICMTAFLVLLIAALVVLGSPGAPGGLMTSPTRHALSPGGRCARDARCRRRPACRDHPVVQHTRRRRGGWNDRSQHARRNDLRTGSDDLAAGGARPRCRRRHDRSAGRPLSRAVHD